ncbi:hypothetical protein BDF21DRAFT_432176 [Thamnidium elegans]|nr:hypothetical protein BDF21DRAFT_432176 [Thamnidium elegans]
MMSPGKSHTIKICRFCLNILQILGLVVVIFVTDSSIKSSLTLPLTPFIALSEFLIDQHPSLASNPFYTDSNIQHLYPIATNIF